MVLNADPISHGKHVVAELFNIAPVLLNNTEFLIALIRTASVEAGATVCETVHKKFEPQGVTVLALLEESHASFHTYPELSALFLDIFTCGSKCDPEKALALICAKLNCNDYTYNVIFRNLARDSSKITSVPISNTQGRS